MTVLRWLRICVLMGIGVCLTLAQPKFAWADADSTTDSPEFREPDTSPEKQRTVTVAIYLLIAMTVGAVSFLMILMLWGARARRLARQPLPKTSPNDPLWYLKGKKPHEPKAETDPQEDAQP